MTDLSPAAQAVINAAFSAGEKYGENAALLHARIAAALRATVDELGYSNVPEEFAHLRPFVIDTDDLLAIATEIENQPISEIN